MTPLLQVGAATLMIALSYAVILAISTVAFIVVDRRCELFPSKAPGKEKRMKKSQMIFDEIGTDVSGPVREAILSIDRLEKENEALKAAKPVPEPKVNYSVTYATAAPAKAEEPVSEDAED